MDASPPRPDGEESAVSWAVDRGYGRGGVRRGRRRWLVAALIPVVVVVGLVTRFGLSGLAGDVAGGLLYAVLVYLGVAFVAPRLSSLVTGAVALGICVAIEWLQLTSLPLRLAELFAPFALVLGTHFSLADLPPYVVGAITATAVDRFLRNRPPMNSQ